MKMLVKRNQKSLMSVLYELPMAGSGIVVKKDQKSLMSVLCEIPMAGSGIASK